MGSSTTPAATLASRGASIQVARSTSACGRATGVLWARGGYRAVSAGELFAGKRHPDCVLEPGAPGARAGRGKLITPELMPLHVVFATRRRWQHDVTPSPGSAQGLFLTLRSL